MTAVFRRAIILETESPDGCKRVDAAFDAIRERCSSPEEISEWLLTAIEVRLKVEPHYECTCIRYNQLAAHAASCPKASENSLAAPFATE